MTSVLRQEGIRANAVFSASATSNSIPIDVERPRGLTVFIPSGWVDADIVLETSIDGTNWYEAELTQLTDISTSAAKQYPFDAEAIIAGVADFIRLKSVTVDGSTPVVQSITVIVGFLN